MSDQPLAVIDVGSNSGRMVVVELHDCHLEIRADARVPLRLASELKNGYLSAAAQERTMSSLRDFLAIASAAGAARVLAVATSAVRESSNAAELLRRASDELGLPIEIIDGDREAGLAFLGAIWSLPVEDGLLIDMGGGSVEVTSFHARARERSWTFPLGALRLSERFLAGDPPTSKEIAALCDHVLETVAKSDLPALRAGESLVGSGGTIRTLARIDRHERNHLIPRIHGYDLSIEVVGGLAESLASRPLTKRASMRGLGHDRADSIVAGSFVVWTFMEAVGASVLTVSGHGLREGVALDRLAGPPPAPAEIRKAAMSALTARFTTWNAETARRRATIAGTLASALAPDTAPEPLEMLHHAALLLDVGGSIDHYNKHKHAALIAVSSDLTGFSHRQLAMLAALIRKAEDAGTGLKVFRQLLSTENIAVVSSMAAVLALATEVERRLPPDAPAVTCTMDRRSIRLQAPVPSGWWSAEIGQRIRTVFRKKLLIEGSEQTQ